MIKKLIIASILLATTSLMAISVEEFESKLTSGKLPYGWKMGETTCKDMKKKLRGNEKGGYIEFNLEGIRMYCYTKYLPDGLFTRITLYRSGMKKLFGTAMEKDFRFLQWTGFDEGRNQQTCSFHTDRHNIDGAYETRRSAREDGRKERFIYYLDIHDKSEGNAW
jgi:hypothetical protein